MIASILQKPILGLLVLLLVFNLTQRRHLAYGEKKRFAALGLAGLFLILYAGITISVHFSSPDYTVLFPIFAVILIAVLFRKRIFLFSFRCRECGKRLPLKVSLYVDSNLCTNCDADGTISAPRDVTDIDWNLWEPDEDAVLCFIVKDGKILLIHKKTGLGAGKINAPGGRVEKNESPYDAAIRETEEEVCLTPSNPVKRADLSFEFTNGYSLHCSAFFAESCSGTMAETDEATPFWCDLKEIPFDRMWQDDQIWLPRALSGESITGIFIFDEDTMLSYRIFEGIRNIEK